MSEKPQIRESLQDYKNCNKQNCRENYFKTLCFIMLEMLHPMQLNHFLNKYMKPEKNTWETDEGGMID